MDEKVRNMGCPLVFSLVIALVSLNLLSQFSASYLHYPSPSPTKSPVADHTLPLRFHFVHTPMPYPTKKLVEDAPAPSKLRKRDPWPPNFVRQSPPPPF
ncbi:hypothetical protein SDJN03_07405, partial [Cucurbita argyrosperma subsp. sororia]